MFTGSNLWVGRFLWGSREDDLALKCFPFVLLFWGSMWSNFWQFFRWQNDNGSTDKTEGISYKLGTRKPLKFLKIPHIKSCMSEQKMYLRIIGICQMSHKALTLISCKPWWWTDRIARLWVKNSMFHNYMNKNILSWNKEVFTSVQGIPVFGTVLKIVCLILVITRLVKAWGNMPCS